MRAHHLWLRIALFASLALQGLAWYLGAELMTGLLFVPTSILVTLVMLYLPRSGP